MSSVKRERNEHQEGRRLMSGTVDLWIDVLAM